MRKFLTCLLVAIVATACSSTPSAEIIQTAIAQTAAAQVPTDIPTPILIPTPTEIELDKIDFTSLVLQDGDLPSGYSAGQIVTFENASPYPLFLTFQRNISFGNDAGGFVRIYLFKKSEHALETYSRTARIESGTGYDGDVLDGIGQKAAWMTMEVPVGDYLKVRNAFGWAAVCNAFIEISLDYSSDKQAIKALVGRTATHIQPYVCQ